MGQPDNASLVIVFLNYNCWANLQLIDACLALSDEQLAASAPGTTYGSIYDTFKHILRSEANYYRRITGGVILEPSFEWEDKPRLAESRPYAEQVGRALVEAAAKMQSTDMLERDWEEEGYPARFKAVGMLVQVVNHGVEHRTNITTILAQQGIEAPDLSGWEYIRVNLGADQGSG